MNYKQKALDHVRIVCPELMELSRGCCVECEPNLQHPKYVTATGKNSEGEEYIDITPGSVINRLYKKKKFAHDKTYKIIGHTPHLEHWLRGIGTVSPKPSVDLWSIELEINSDRKDNCLYNLTKDGENQSDEFYKAYCEIVGV